MKEWIEETLDRLPFVTWDRYVEFETLIRVYGWIEREEDEYKDFVLLDFSIEGWSTWSPVARNTVRESLKSSTTTLYTQSVNVLKTVSMWKTR